MWKIEIVSVALMVTESAQKRLPVVPTSQFPYCHSLIVIPLPAAVLISEVSYCCFFNFDENICCLYHTVIYLPVYMYVSFYQHTYDLCISLKMIH